MAFPHISASVPSGLNIRILKSATTLGHIRTIPSLPIAKCLLDTNLANSFKSFGNSWLIASIYT